MPAQCPDRAVSRASVKLNTFDTKVLTCPLPPLPQIVLSKPPPGLVTDAFSLLMPEKAQVGWGGLSDHASSGTSGRMARPLGHVWHIPGQWASTYTAGVTASVTVPR